MLPAEFFQRTASTAGEFSLSVNEKEAIVNALARAQNNKSEAAKLLNITRKTLYNKIKLYEIN